MSSSIPSVETAAGGRLGSMPGHVRRWVLGASAMIAATMLLFVATTASDRVVEAPELKQMFDIGRESNFPTFVNTILLVAVAAVAATVAWLHPDRPVRRALWWVVAIVSLLAIDEASGLHERFGAPTARYLDDNGIELPTYAWLLPGVVAVIAGAVVAYRVGRPLPKPLARGLVTAGFVFVAGAIVMEGINGWVRDIPSKLGFFVGTMIEESLEMGACVLAGAALLRMIDVETGPDGVTIRSANPKPRHVGQGK